MNTTGCNQEEHSGGGEVNRFKSALTTIQISPGISPRRLLGVPPLPIHHSNYKTPKTNDQLKRADLSQSYVFSKGSSYGLDRSTY